MTARNPMFKPLQSISSGFAEVASRAARARRIGRSGPRLRDAIGRTELSGRRESGSSDTAARGVFAGVAARWKHFDRASQHGSLGIAVLDLAAERELGLSSFVNVGNKADVLEQRPS
jgi:acyl-CoA synthetase (NDP forming)